MVLLSSPFRSYCLTVEPSSAPNRIDRFLSDALEISRSKLQAALRDGLVAVNGCTVKSSYTVQAKDKVLAYIPIPVDLDRLIPEAIELDIVYEDADLLLIHKPAQMVVHPDTAHRVGTVANALLHRYTTLPLKNNLPTRPGLVHRLDKDTSGLLVVAKTAESLAALEKQFYEHTVVRAYYALVWGSPLADVGSIDVPIGKSNHTHQVISVFPDRKGGKRAITHYRVIQRWHYVSLVACQLETGRTHQIRVHMKHIGHPILGDSLYGGRTIVYGQQYTSYKAFVNNCFKLMPYQALHAFTLGFQHPRTHAPMLFEAPLPENFIRLMEKWKKYAASTVRDV